MPAHGPLEVFASVCLLLAVLHTFLVKRIQMFSRSLRKGSLGRRLGHVLGEVELVFGVWAGVYLAGLTLAAGPGGSWAYLSSVSFAEPVFVLAVMAVCSSRPVIGAASRMISVVAALLPGPRRVTFFATALVLGPVSGSLITEPAAMTVTALVLLERYFNKGRSQGFLHATLALLFVNVSIGGTLTPYAAPPVLMVASKWGWDLRYMFTHFGWKACLAIAVATAWVVFRHRKELESCDLPKRVPIRAGGVALALVAFAMLGAMVLSLHQPLRVLGLLGLFFGMVRLAPSRLGSPQLKEGLLVGAFLAGLVVLGGPQRWWLEPLLAGLGTLPLFLGSVALTAVTDNAALTYLGAQVPTLSEASRYALVAGAVCGGGLTVIANAPNPAGYGILGPAFGQDGISPWKLFLGALGPTFIAACAFWFL